MRGMASLLRRKLPPFIVPFHPDDKDFGPTSAPSRRLQLVPPPTDAVQPEPVPPNFNSGAISDTINLPPLSTADMARVGGRPSRGYAANEEDYNQGLQAYEPRQGRSLGRTLKEAALGFIEHGLPGAIGSAATELLDPNLRERQWRNRELDRSDARIDRSTQQRHAGLQENLIRSQIAENQAQANRVPASAGDWFQLDTDGDGIPDTEEYRPKTIGSRRNVYKTPRAERQPILKERVNADGTKSTLKSDDNGSTWTEVPDLLSQPSPKEDTSGFTNGQIQTSINEAQTERDGILKTLNDNHIAPTMPGDFIGQTKENPIYKDYMDRYRQLDDKIRGWRNAMKPGRQSAPTKTLDPALEQQIRDAAKAKHLDPDIAVRRALARQ